MVQQHDVGFAVEGGVTLRGWLFVPDAAGAHPGITIAHGYAGVREHGLERFARVFAEAGFVVLVHDHRGFGASDGEPRYDVDPWRQIADWRRAISYLESRPEVDPHRIGLWGTSYAGGHAIVLGATDRRLRAVVAQVPTISGYQPMIGANSAVNRRSPRPLSARIRMCRRPTVRKTRSRFTPSRCPTASGTTSSPCAPPGPRACMSRERGFRGCRRRR
jgi:cephalosporin-C deacetylase-like acetyl esterase